MKKLIIAFLCCIAMLGAAASEPTPLVYGVRVYSDSNQPIALVSFPVDRPSETTDVVDLSAYFHIRAGACDGSHYYMITSDDGISSTSLIAIDMLSLKVATVKDFDWKVDVAGTCLFLDMAFHPKSGLLYAVGIDLMNAEIVDDEIIADLGLYTIDPKTGDANLIGTQGTTVVNAITFMPSGDMLGIDENGDLWTIDTNKGLPSDIIFNTNVRPNGNQSMTTNPDTGDVIWAAFTTDTSGNAKSNLLCLTDSGNGNFTMADYGQIADNAELVGLYIDTKPANPKAPMAVGGFSAIASSATPPAATLRWTNPTATIDGAPLTALSLTIRANDKIVHTITSAAPGQACQWQHTTVNAETIVYSIQASANGYDGKYAFAEPIYVGADTPAAVRGLTAARVPGSYSITVSWGEPLSGEHGGLFDPTGMTYEVIRRPDGKVVAAATTATTITDNDISRTHGYFYEVTPTNAAGRGVTLASNACLSGPALSLPYSMNLSDTDDANMWTVCNLDNDPYEWHIESNWGGTMEPFFRYYPVEIMDPTVAADDWLISPLFSLSANKFYALSYETRLWGSLFPADYDVVIGKGSKTEDLTTVLESRREAVNDLTWEPRAIAFAVDADGDYSVAFKAVSANTIDIYKVALHEIKEHDIAVTTPEGNMSVGINTPETYTTLVTNTGFRPIASATVDLVDAAGNVLATAIYPQTIEPQQSVTVTIEWTPANAGEIALSARASSANASATSAPLTVSVNSSAQWINITDGTALTGYAPFYLQYAYSGTQTLYPEELLQCSSATIEGITYYYMVMGAAPETFHATLSMANTDITNFADGDEPLASDEFTTVFDGDITIDKNRDSFTLMFDSPFTYTGKSLCLAACHSSTSTASLIFKASRDTDSKPCMALYRSDSDPYAFSHDNLFTDRPNISLYLTSMTSINGIDADDVRITYDPASQTVILGDAGDISVWNSQGMMLRSAVGVKSLNIADLPSGVLIVKAGTEALKVIK